MNMMFQLRKPGIEPTAIRIALVRTDTLLYKLIGFSGLGIYDEIWSSILKVSKNKSAYENCPDVPTIVFTVDLPLRKGDFHTYGTE